MEEPVRLIQTNLRESDAPLDPKHLIDQVSSFPANTLLLNMGGIVAFYLTQTEFHYPSKFLPPGRDTFGDVLREAHARHIRVIARFDLSKTQKPVFDAHPEWFFQRTTGEPAIYNGLYSTCINGGYYRQHALKILTEALDRYDVDGVFFNMFGNPSADYSGKLMGPCHCAACRQKFQSEFKRPLPERNSDPDYGKFLSRCSREVAGEFAKLIHQLRPHAAFITYIQEETDGIMSESNTSVDRPLPLWPYSASENVNRARTSQPNKMAFNLCMSFIDFPWRFATVAPAEIELRLYEAMAAGGPLALNMHGTMDQEDRSALMAARPIFQWHAQHESFYAGQQNAARVLLLSGNQKSFRGFFRLLTEEHIPFAASDNLNELTNFRNRYDLIVAPDGLPKELEPYLREGGRALVAGAKKPSFAFPEAKEIHAPVRGYWRVRDKSLFPSLSATDLLFFEGAYLDLGPVDRPVLTLIPPAMFGPPEKVWADKVETEIPGLALKNFGQGKIAFLPWDIGTLYHMQSSPPHRQLVRDLVDYLLPAGRQVQTDAHPLVEITLMRQPSHQRMLLHLINHSGHSDTAYFPPLSMDDIRVTLTEKFQRARSLRLQRDLPVERRQQTGSFTLPRLGAYDVVVLE